MIKGLLISQDKTRFKDMINAFQTKGIQMDLVQSCDLVLNIIADSSYNLLIVDEQIMDMTARNLIEKTILKNPFMNCVLASDISKKDFHVKYEGMGVLMQLTLSPDFKEVQKLLDHMDKIYSLFKK